VSDDLRDLYQDIIIEHSKRPRNFHPMEDGQKAEGFNPLCGDVCTVYVSLEGDVVRDVSFQGSGCAISTASASVMTETLKGKTRRQIEELFGNFHGLVTGTRSPDPIELGKLAVFSGVSEYPTRVKCATLCWHTLRAALEGRDEPVSTE